LVDKGCTADKKMLNFTDQSVYFIVSIVAVPYVENAHSVKKLMEEKEQLLWQIMM
jgi:hypothetical protein